MLACASAAMIRPSPSLKGGLSGPSMGAPIRSVAMSLFHSKPPLARMTARRAPIRTMRPSCSTSMPTMAPSSITRRRPRALRRNSTPLSTAPLIRPAISAMPVPTMPLARRSPMISGSSMLVPSSMSVIATGSGKQGAERRCARSSPNSPAGKRPGLTERPKVPPGCSG